MKLRGAPWAIHSPSQVWKVQDSLSENLREGKALRSILYAFPDWGHTPLPYSTSMNIDKMPCSCCLRSSVELSVGLKARSLKHGILCRNKNRLESKVFSVHLRRNPASSKVAQTILWMMRPFKVSSLTLKSVQRDPKVFLEGLPCCQDTSRPCQNRPISCLVCNRFTQRTQHRNGPMTACTSPMDKDMQERNSCVDLRNADWKLPRSRPSY